MSDLAPIGPDRDGTPGLPPESLIEEVAPVGPSPQLTTEPTPASTPRYRRLPTVGYFALSLLSFAGASALDNTRVAWLPPLLFITGVVLLGLATLVAVSRTLKGLFDLVRAAHNGTTFDAHALAATMGNAVMALFGIVLTYLGTFGFSRGRQLRRFGKVLLPEVRPGGTWMTAPIAPDAPCPPAVADQWRENGKTEHASVAAFARLTLDLMALGAPPALVAAANRDALDEIRHTELCFSLAGALDGKTMSPGPFPEAQRAATLPRARTLALATLAVDSLIDGALHEGVSARIIAKLAQRCAAPAIRAVLREIAADEGRHAAHGWQVVAWCLEQGGTPVAHALRGAARALPPEMQSSLPGPAVEGAWERWGIHGRRLESLEYGAGRAHVIERVSALVDRRGAAA